MPGATRLQFYYVIADSKVDENTFKQNSPNAIVYKIQLIYSTVKTSKWLLLSHAMSYRSAISPCYRKLGE